MQIYTLAGASKKLGCSTSRLSSWIDKGYLKTGSIDMGTIQARVLDDDDLRMLEMVLSGIDQERMKPKEAFQKYYG